MPAPCHPIPRSGEVLRNSEGSEFIVLSAASRNKLNIKYLDNFGHETTVSLGRVLGGSIKNPFAPKVYGFGYMGVGSHRSAIKGKRTPEYETWKAMMSRAYDARLHQRNPAYSGCSVCPEWHNFQTFADWLHSQDNWLKPGFEMDKDIAHPGNKIYGPEFCELIPRRINALRMVTRSREDLPPGVSTSPNGRYRASCRNGNGNVKLGTHSSKEAAFSAYKAFKESVIREAANYHRNEISERAYLSMINHAVTQ